LKDSIKFKHHMTNSLINSRLFGYSFIVVKIIATLTAISAMFCLRDQKDIYYRYDWVT
jgi:hypothetical protein